MTHLGWVYAKLYYVDTLTEAGLHWYIRDGVLAEAVPPCSMICLTRFCGFGRR